DDKVIIQGHLCADLILPAVHMYIPFHQLQHGKAPTLLSIFISYRKCMWVPGKLCFRMSGSSRQFFLQAFQLFFHLQNP
ncbi:hypothetical protein DK853_42375, partial [Klebsiella oxytoca]